LRFIDRGKTKSRTVPGPQFSLRNETEGLPPSNVKTLRKKLLVPIDGIQITESDGNRWPLPRKAEVFVDSGSEFYTQKTEVLPPIVGHTVLHLKGKAIPIVGQDYYLGGNFMLANAWGTNGQLFADTAGTTTCRSDLLAPTFTDLSSTRAALNVKGSIAIAAVQPTNQIAQAARSVGELLKDVPAIPGASLWKSKLRAAEVLAASAGEYLNTVFAIMPTITDLSDFLKATHKVDRLVDQFIRDSGRLVRREFRFPKEMSDETTEVTGYSPLGCSSSTNNLYPEPSLALPIYKTMRRRVIEREIWFSGAFTYYMPYWYETGNRSDRIRLTAELLGAKPDLNTLWQLAPWSWAAGWFSNSNAFMKNLSSLIQYGTILQYGYVMETTTVTDTYFAGDVVRQPVAPYSGMFKPPYPAVTPITFRTTVKKRVKANPFGFGVSWDGLSTAQQAIVAALGITRVVR
jgi:hypothetical protein